MLAKRILLLTACLVAILIVISLGIWQRPLPVHVDSDEIIMVAGQSRHYRLVIPDKLTQPAPIVFAWHGVGDSPATMAGYAQLDSLAAQQGFLLVYPAAQQAMWKTVDIDFDALATHPDVRFFDELLADLVRRYDIDTSRIYVVGMSNGATFAQLLTAARPHIIAACVAHSGPAPRAMPAISNSPPILRVIGEEDSAADVMRDEDHQDLQAGRTTEFIVVPGLGHAWSTQHNAQMWRFLSQQPAE